MDVRPDRVPVSGAVPDEAKGSPEGDGISVSSTYRTNRGYVQKTLLIQFYRSRARYVQRSLQHGWRLLRTRPRGWRNFLINHLASELRLPYAPAMPVHITIEPTTACNARCPVCETGAMVLGRKAGTMDLLHFQRVVDQIAPGANTLLFYFMGEPFLNKSAYEMVEYARRKGLYVATSTNGDFVDPQRLVDCGIDMVYFQVGGMTEPTHQRYRINSLLSRVVPNLEAAIAAKRAKYGDSVPPDRYRELPPKIVLGLIVMKHNEHEIPAFLEWGKQLGADQVNLVPPVVRNVAQGKMYLPDSDQFWLYDRSEFETNGKLVPKPAHKNDCTLIWNSTIITWNGDVVPCCRDPQAKFVMGNVFETPLRKIWNNEKYVAFRKRLLRDQKSIGICRLCTEFVIPVPVAPRAQPAVPIGL